jgi:hypothetical protein
MLPCIFHDWDLRKKNCFLDCAGRLLMHNFHIVISNKIKRHIVRAMVETVECYVYEGKGDEI